MTISDSGCRTIGLLLIPGFALFSYAAALEPLRAANVLSGRSLYRWLHLSSDGVGAAASSGIVIPADRPRLDAAGLDALVVCAGGNPALYRDRTTLRWLGGLRRKAIAIGGVSGGPYLLARAGLLEGRRCTVHWEHAPAFAEAFPNLDLRQSLYEIDGPRMTCAGGVAALDMMAAMIERDHGPVLARQVGDWFLQGKQRTGADAQRMSLRERTGVANQSVLAALTAMDGNVEEPLSLDAIAAASGVGRRQLERLFRDHLRQSVATRYRDIRLDRARILLAETAMPVAEAGNACGFVSAAHFSRAFAARYGVSPARFRRGGLPVLKAD